ncbi:GreA/GreB family elongation factor [uncultured Roseovarius sp.]|uniref:GreA/GreB family elongation factor n=1 Tax=uncultured Roseovarius sp. TaxID=293344 RepID=UPI002607BE6B|nr:GreA/GreB family elongation factor [uncultured Roseovarius sp.]
MNKAFTKEEDGSTPPRLPDLPVSEHPNHVTPRGLAMLQEQQKVVEAEVGRLRDNREFLDDLYPLAVAERDLRYVEARLASAVLVTPPEHATHVSFGAKVTVEDEDGKTASYTIVGEDEAQPEIGLIAAFSPLARALMEAQVGDIVEWPKPTGTVELEIIDILF